MVGGGDGDVDDDDDDGDGDGDDDDCDDEDDDDGDKYILNDVCGCNGASRQKMTCVAMIMFTIGLVVANACLEKVLFQISVLQSPQRLALSGPKGQRVSNNQTAEKRSSKNQELRSQERQQW